ncbi:hypothetical protein LINPERHAP2_LOCUS23113 [Linum perenne]
MGQSLPRNAWDKVSHDFTLAHIQLTSLFSVGSVSFPLSDSNVARVHRWENTQSRTKELAQSSHNLISASLSLLYIPSWGEKLNQLSSLPATAPEPCRSWSCHCKFTDVAEILRSREEKMKQEIEERQREKELMEETIKGLEVERPKKICLDDYSKLGFLSSSLSMQLLMPKKKVDEADNCDIVMDVKKEVEELETKEATGIGIGSEKMPM